MNHRQPLFLVRMSSIGDIVIALHTAHRLKQKGQEPIFVSALKFQDIFFQVEQWLKFLILIDEKNLNFYFEGVNVSHASFLEKLTSDDFESSSLDILDIQNTSRSRRAIKLLKKSFSSKNLIRHAIMNQRAYRLSLVWKSFFHFSQQVRRESISVNSIQNIYEKQLDFTEQFAEKFINSKINTPIFRHTSPLLAKPYVVIFPGASHQTKRWPLDHFADLITLILNKTKLDIVVIGGATEVQAGKDLEKVGKVHSLSQRIHNFCGNLGLKESFQWIAHAEHVYTNDSFPAHVAYTFQRPTSIFFGSTTPLFGFAPKGKDIKIQYRNLDCSPCSRHGSSSCRFGNLKCLSEISPEEAFQDLAPRDEMLIPS